MGLEEIKVRVTIGDLEEFKESLLWKDIRRELLAWKRGFESEMRAIVDNASSSNPSTANVLMHMGDINGRIKAVDYMLSLPEIFINILKDDQGEKATTNINEGD